MRAYNFALDKFMIQSKLTEYDKVINLKTDRIQDLLEDYIISLNHLKYNTANQYLAGVELFFDMNMILIHKRILRKLLSGNNKENGGKLPYTTEEIDRMLSVSIKLRSKAVIHFFASTWCRPASITDPILRLKHVEDIPVGCKSIRIYEGSKEEHFVFLTPEVSKALDQYLNQRKLNGEILSEDSPVLANTLDFYTTKQSHMSQNSVRQIIRDAKPKPTKNRFNRPRVRTVYIVHIWDKDQNLVSPRKFDSLEMAMGVTSAALGAKVLDDMLKKDKMEKGFTQKFQKRLAKTISLP